MWGWEFEDNHLEHSISGRKPLLHNTLKEGLSNQFLFVTLHFDANGLEKLLHFFVLLVHDSIEQSSDGGSDELAKRTLEATILIGGSPCLTGGIKVPVTPELAHHFLNRHAELCRISHGELLECECPLMQTGSERNCTLGGVHLNISKSFVVVGGHNHIHRFDGTAKGLVELFTRKLELQECTVHLVNHQNWLHSFSDSLS
mmetsp:Transcript_43960/g.51502  ORF Transcript_43960/g.51502 Transcript_43960/m.51502 type:complete len:201 (-) Transcript_43960:627-1229(-)